MSGFATFGCFETTTFSPKSIPMDPRIPVIRYHRNVGVLWDHKTARKKWSKGPQISSGTVPLQVWAALCHKIDSLVYAKSKRLQKFVRWSLSGRDFRGGGVEGSRKSHPEQPATVLFDAAICSKGVAMVLLSKLATASVDTEVFSKHAPSNEHRTARLDAGVFSKKTKLAPKLITPLRLVLAGPSRVLKPSLKNRKH